MRRGSEFVFSRVPTADIPRSVFNRSHTHKTTFDSGLLVPIFVDEALPGDTFSVNMSCFARLATPLVPIMDSLEMDVFFFAVPNRLLWDNWQKFMGEQANPNDSTDYLIPTLEMGTAPTVPFEVGSLGDYFGLPVEIAGLTGINALPFRAYNLIYNEWFRDENLQNSLTVRKDDGPDSYPAYYQNYGPTGADSLLRRGKRHDYFTSCLPWPQKGPGVMLPLGDTAPVEPVAGAYPTFNSAGGPQNEQAWRSGSGTMNLDSGGSAVAGNITWANPGLEVDLSSATAATINSLRQAFQVQKLLERDARGGTRYTEILRSHFGVVSPDARLQRPEYLGGGRVPVSVHPVVQTSGSPPDSSGYTPTPQGNLAAFGTAGGTGIGFSKSFVEHCIIIGLISVRAELTYQQGINRMWSRSTRYDFYWPAFAHLGEQAVLQKEIFCSGVPAEDEAVFGYQERWAEYRYFPSKITGKFRSGITGGSLDVWHLAQNFSTAPVLSNEFIVDAPPVDRVLAVTGEPQFLFDSHFSIRCARPMPTYSVPGLTDHF